MRWTVIGAVLFLAACQTTGGQQTAVRDASTVDQPAGANCEEVILTGSPLWNELMSWKHVNPTCKRVVGYGGFQASAFEIGAKLKPSVDSALLGVTKAPRIVVQVVRFDRTISDTPRYYRGAGMADQFLPDPLDATLYTGPVRAHARRMVAGDETLYGCLTAIVGASHGGSSLVNVCRTARQKTDNSILALARRIASRDFPFINP